MKHLKEYTDEPDRISYNVFHLWGNLVETGEVSSLIIARWKL